MGIKSVLLTHKLDTELPYQVVNYARFRPRAISIIPMLIKYIIAARRIAKKVDILQCQLIFPSFAWVGDLIKFRSKIPVIVAFGGLIIERQSEILANMKLSPMLYIPRFIFNNTLIARLSSYSCDMYVVNTQYQKEQILRLGLVNKEKLTVIPNSVNLENFKKIDSTIFRRSLQFNESIKIILNYWSL